MGRGAALLASKLSLLISHTRFKTVRILRKEFKMKKNTTYQFKSQELDSITSVFMKKRPNNDENNF